MALNKVIHEGRLTADPELKQTPGGLSVVSFTLAINYAKDKADFFHYVAWRHTAEFICKWFRKGDGVGVIGHIKPREYEKGGVKHRDYEIEVEEAYFPEGRRADSGERGGGNADPPRFEEVSADGDLPF